MVVTYTLEQWREKLRNTDYHENNEVMLKYMNGEIIVDTTDTLSTVQKYKNYEWNEMLNEAKDNAERKKMWDLVRRGDVLIIPDSKQSHDTETTNGERKIP